ncbi:MAG: YceI family protein, partial [Acidobacteriota bacterium]
MPPMLPVRTAVAPIRPSAICLLVAAFFLATAGVAAERTLTLDPEASTATFVLEATAHQVHGRLDVPAASITFDDATGEAAGTLRLDARRVTTDHTKRDAKMHREVLKSEDHPSILFEVERLKGEPWRGTPGANSTVDAVLVGTVTLAGSRHPLEIPL